MSEVTATQIFWHAQAPSAGRGLRRACRLLALGAADLGALGYSDQWLVDAVREELGETYTPEKPGPCQLRREFFNRVQKKMHGQ